MKIALVTPLSEPALKGMVTGNEITARRWEEILQKLGHAVTVLEGYDGEAAALSLSRISSSAAAPA